MEEMVAGLRERFPQVELGYYQSNVEGEIINRLHEVVFSVDGIVLNAGGSVFCVMLSGWMSFPYLLLVLPYWR